jgi:hypothetical protein
MAVLMKKQLFWDVAIYQQEILAQVSKYRTAAIFRIL